MLMPLHNAYTQYAFRFRKITCIMHICKRFYIFCVLIWKWGHLCNLRVHPHFLNDMTYSEHISKDKIANARQSPSNIAFSFDRRLISCSQAGGGGHFVSPVLLATTAS